MGTSESPSITVVHGASPQDDGVAGHTVVSLRGEHDLATKVALMLAMEHAAPRSDALLVVDLSEVTFMDAATVGALVWSSNRLRARSQSLEVRAPSRSARRVLELGGLAHLIHPTEIESSDATMEALMLGTLVGGPAATSQVGRGGP